ncbi:MAG: peptide-methionine (S)-S-oxide reductase MsrA [Chthoniobacterales bacterium]
MECDRPSDIVVTVKAGFLLCICILLGVVDVAWAQTTTHASEEKAIFAGGCFWCMQPPFDRTPGVIATKVGFSGGRESNPTYRQVSSGQTWHREVIEVTFEPATISYSQLLDIFWRNINPIQRDGQFRDFGDQYKSAIYYTPEDQHHAAEESKNALSQSGKFQKPIVTEILPASQFWPADEFHQKYYQKHPEAYGMYYFTSGRGPYKQRVWRGGK